MQQAFSESQKSRTEVGVRQTRLDDADGVAALQAACFPPPFPAEALFSASHVRRHVEVYPAGQFVGAVGEAVVASATNMLMSVSEWERHGPWVSAVGGLDLSAHDPGGTVLFGVDISVAPAWRRAGVGRRLYTARFDLVRGAGLDMYGTVCRLPGFATSGIDSVEAYADLVERGQLEDRTMTPLLRLGLAFEGIVEGYMEDEESGDAGAVLTWKP